MKNLFLVFMCVIGTGLFAQVSSPHEKIIEIRSYTLKPGSRDAFHKLAMETALPLLKRWNIEVVSLGPSLHDENSYLLIRAFDSREDRESKEEAFYGSDDWMKGPREEVLSRIENYTTVVIPASDALIKELAAVTYKSNGK